MGKIAGTALVALLGLGALAGCTSAASDGTAEPVVDRIGQIDDASTTTLVDPHAGRDPQHALILNVPEEVGDYVVTVKQIKADATADVLRAHGAYLQPKHGQYMLVTFETLYVGKRTGAPRFDLSVTLVGGDGLRYTLCRGGLAASGAPALATGQRASMSVCLDVDPRAIPSSVVLITAYSSPAQRSNAYWMVA